MPDGQAGTAPREATPPSELPTWNLADLYEAPDSAQLAGDLDRAEAEAKGFAATYAGKLAGLPGAALAAAIVGL